MDHLIIFVCDLNQKKQNKSEQKYTWLLATLELEYFQHLPHMKND